MGIVNALVFLATLFLGMFIGSYSSFKHFPDYIDQVVRGLVEVDEHKREVYEDEMSLEDDNESIC